MKWRRFYEEEEIKEGLVNAFCSILPFLSFNLINVKEGLLFKGRCFLKEVEISCLFAILSSWIDVLEKKRYPAQDSRGQAFFLTTVSIRSESPRRWYPYLFKELTDLSLGSNCIIGGSKATDFKERAMR